MEKPHYCENNKFFLTNKLSFATNLMRKIIIKVFNHTVCI